jgi:16S rRNA (guanine527-N7)-methyltransferase
MKIGSDEWSELIIDGARAFDLDLERHHTDLFAVHAQELLHWNQTINLTAITDPFEIALKHFVDSLAPAGLISSRATLLDIGSGGGFPGIPLKVAIPNLSLTVIDASRKKINFLKHVIRTLDLEDIIALHIRAEDLADDPAYRKHFDVITSRALTDLNSFIRQARPLLAAKGQMIALKGKMDQPEVETGDAYTPIAKTYLLPFTQTKRSIFIIR